MNSGEEKNYDLLCNKNNKSIVAKKEHMCIFLSIFYLSNKKQPGFEDDILYKELLYYYSSLRDIFNNKHYSKSGPTAPNTQKILVLA